MRLHFVGETAFEQLIQIAWAARHDAGRLKLSRELPDCFAESLKSSGVPTGSPHPHWPPSDLSGFRQQAALSERGLVPMRQKR
ncbi:hypothetical protein [Bradyrhizobium sp. th.b2]|uniref:hypothetical protein n=1 Tax=Bradyrhizobium sp. th-b2 TaxID=172088 RepID=UPI0004137D49|nr:hypothetical protein [Bradyrhizobium sp. th.b2]